MADLRLPSLIARDGHHADDDAVILLGIFDLVAVGAWRLRRHGLRRSWRHERAAAPPAGSGALAALDAGLRNAPAEDGGVPVNAVGWWMRHWGIGATRVRGAALQDPVPPPAGLPPRPGREATDVEVALGGFPASRGERDFVQRVLKARDTPTGLADEQHNGDNSSAAVRYGLPL